MKKRKKKKEHKSPRTYSNESPSFHNDDKATVVIIKDNIYTLKLTNLTLDELKQRPVKDCPHVRYLNWIPIRTHEQQEENNKVDEEVKRILDDDGGERKRSKKVTSLKKAAKLGTNLPEEINKLLKQKEEAKKKGDEKEMRRIRQVLRKLDYKRYKEKKC